MCKVHICKCTHNLHPISIIFDFNVNRKKHTASELNGDIMIRTDFFLSPSATCKLRFSFFLKSHTREGWRMYDWVVKRCIILISEDENQSDVTKETFDIYRKQSDSSLLQKPRINEIIHWSELVCVMITHSQTMPWDHIALLLLLLCVYFRT